MVKNFEKENLYRKSLRTNLNLTYIIPRVGEFTERGGHDGDADHVPGNSGQKRCPSGSSNVRKTRLLHRGSGHQDVGKVTQHNSRP